MAKPKESTAERQARLFGAPKPAPVTIIPPPNVLPESGAADSEGDTPDFDAFLQDAQASEPEPFQSFPGGTRYFGFRSRHSAHAPWTVAPGRWPTVAQAADFAKQAKELDDRLEVQIFPV